MTLEELFARFSKPPQRAGAEWKALCPAHVDRNPSLCIKESDGKLLLKCQAGCETRDICAQLGIKMSDLSNGHKGRNKKEEKLGPIVAKYDYTDETGRLLYQVTRHDPKDFRQRRPDGNGAWTWGLKDTRKVLYRLSEVVAADEVLICEGEKDCETARQLGLVATCNPMGAGKWRGEYCDSLRGKHITIIADADTAGRNHAQSVAKSLEGKVESLKLLELPGAKDLSEWAERGFDRKLLEALVAETEEWQSDWLMEELDLGKITDAGNADLLVAAEGDTLRFCFEMKTWLWWDGKRWLVDDKQFARRLMEKTMRERVVKAAAAGGKDKIILASSSLDSARITNGLHEAEKKLGVAASKLDTHPFLLTFENGTLNLKTMKLEPHDRQQLITKMVHCNYDESAACPKFVEFLQHAVGEKAIEYVQKLLGYSLTGDTGEKTFVVVWGVGDTGKTTFLEVIRKLLEEYAVLLQVDTLMDRHGGDGSTQEDLAALRGMRIATTSELDQGRKLSIAVLKRIVQGQGKITACAKYQKKIEFYESHKLWFDTNHLPMIPADEQAVWNRVAVVVFGNPVPKNQQDKKLAATLVEKEAEGIIAWMVKGEQLRQSQNGIGEVPESFLAEKEKWQRKMDALQQFIDECCDQGVKFQEKPDVLYKAYVAWVGNPEHAMGRKTFTQRLAKHGIVLDGSRRHYQGVALVRDSEDSDEETAQSVLFEGEKP